MRFNMMPAAMHKMHGMRDFMITGKQSGAPRVDSSHAAALPRSATPAIGPQGVLRPPAAITSSRQDVAARATLKLPSSGPRRHGDNKQHQPMAAQLPQAQPMTRPRNASETGLKRDRHAHENIFEDSTIGSMFGDTASLPTSDGSRGPRHDRHYSTNNGHYATDYQRGDPSREENMPFVFTANGEMKEIKHRGSRSTALAATVMDGKHRGQEVDVPYPYYPADAPQTSPSKRTTLKHNNLPHRDARDAQRLSYADREMAQPLAQKPVALKHDFATEESDRGLDDLLDDFAGVSEPNRETVFHDINTPIIDEPTQWQSDAVEPDLTEHPPVTQEVPSPRPTRQPVNAAILDIPAGAATSLRRTGSNRLENQPNPRKRPISLDYDDHQLNEMGQGSLRGEAFDFDPRTAALQAVTDENALDGADLETRLAHFKQKDSIAQHQFFRQMPVEDWEASGDWFLDQFSKVMKKLRDARKKKRNMVAEFEAEIWAREDAVRAKMDHIGRTLQRFKQDGESLMEGKDVVI
jgi:hypothetical protein